MKDVETSDPLIAVIGIFYAHDCQSHSTLTVMSNKRTFVFATIHIAQSTVFQVLNSEQDGW